MGDRRSGGPSDAGKGDGGGKKEGENEELEIVHHQSGVGAEDMFSYKPDANRDANVDQLLDGVPKATLGEHGAHRVAYGGGSRGALNIPKQNTSGTALPRGASGPRIGSGLPGEMIPPPVAQEPEAKALPIVPIAIGAGVVVVAIAGFLLLRPAKEAAVSPAVVMGAIDVSSTPAGAEIWMDGRKTEFVTPHRFAEIPVDNGARFAVKLTNYKSFPPEQVVKAAAAKASEASFVLRAARELTVKSEPPGATVSVNGDMTGGTTPVALPPLLIGEKATIEVELNGYIKGKLELTPSVDTASVASFKLVRAKTIDVISEPEGATVYVDDEARGTTPARNVKVPDSVPFKLKIEKPGYKPWVQKMNPRRMKDEVMVELPEQRLLSLPLTKAERAEAMQLTTNLQHAQLIAERAKKAKADADRALEKMMNDPNMRFGDRARGERTADLATTAAEKAEESLNEAQQAYDAFRSDVMQRLEKESDAKARTP